MAEVAVGDEVDVAAMFGGVAGGDEAVGWVSFFVEVEDLDGLFVGDGGVEELGELELGWWGGVDAAAL